MARSRAKPPVLNRIAPVSRRLALQSRLANDVPHYSNASLEHTHHALELVERKADREEMGKELLDSDEWVMGYLFARAEQKYGVTPAALPAWVNGAAKDGYDFYYEKG